MIKVFWYIYMVIHVDLLIISAEKLASNLGIATRSAINVRSRLRLTVL